MEEAIESSNVNFNVDNFSLVLSGGGALGIAHLGVIYDLQKNDISPSEIIGTSMGGIIGACLAIGLKYDEMYALFEKFSSFLSWIKLSMGGNAIIKSDKIDEIFVEIFQDKKMNDTLIPLKLIATNLLSSEIKVFDKHDDVLIKDALLATMAIPGVFEEKVIDGETYCDGFICANLGIEQASRNDLLAIDVLGKNSFSSVMPDNTFKTQNVMQMFEKSLRLLIYNQTKVVLSNSAKNICLIEPKTIEFQTFHFHKFKQIAQLGKNLLPFGYTHA
ncbi:MAG: patatin-like phospholipase family protein [Campylobacterota bacterium]|nr:patatin-like phospholipase family protein [Campylobacterota bacterium]